MSKIRRICIIVDQYPTEKLPANIFVHQLVVAFTKMGIECTVINPVSVTKVVFRGGELKPKKSIRNVGTEKIKVYSPRYISYSTKKIGTVNTSKITLKAFLGCCKKFFKYNNVKYDAIYGHFIFPAGIVANEISRITNIPAFFAYGENTNYTIDYLGANKTKSLLSEIKGVISVSTDNKENLIKQNIVSEDKIGVFPNSVDTTLFYKRNKRDMREKYNLPQDDFIVIFVGRFVDIKGPDRLSNALDKLGIDKIKSIFIGFGDLKPTYKGTLMQGLQPHSNIPELLSAADVFVLPTLAEGCCNSIIEALSCGLPVVSSNLPFNDDILDEQCSIRVDPNNISEIANAIEKIYYNVELREKYAKGALEKAKDLTIESRAANIINFMESKI